MPMHWRCPDCGTICQDDGAIIRHPCKVSNTVNYAVFVDLPIGVGMSDVVICDLDGEIITRDITGGLIFWANWEKRNSDGAKDLTLCPKCAKEVDEFIQEKQRNRKTHKMMSPYNPDADTETQAIES